MTKTHNPENERIKRRYLTFLKEAKGQSVASVDGVAEALSRFEADTKYNDFKKFRPEQAAAFKRHLAEQRGQRSGEPLSKATLYSTVNALRSFFQWLSGQPGFKRHFTYSDADYFKLLGKDVRIATAHREREGPTLDLGVGPHRIDDACDLFERRDRALVAFGILTGARDSAIASLKLKHIDLAKDLVESTRRPRRPWRMAAALRSAAVLRSAATGCGKKEPSHRSSHTPIITPRSRDGSACADDPH